MKKNTSMISGSELRMLILGGMAAVAISLHGQQSPSLSIDPSNMAKIGHVSSRFLSYNVEMVEVTGGRFWRPYESSVANAGATSAQPNPNQQVGEDVRLFDYRPPIDLGNPRLRKLATALGPSYVRVSGSWANSTYFQNDNNAPVKTPPQGFKGILTRTEWKGVVDFSKATNAWIVTSVAISSGVRDAKGSWTPDQAKALFEYTKAIGGSIAATEFMNEPTFPGPGGAPSGYDAESFARDIKLFTPFLRKESPQTLFLGPGGVGEGISLVPGGAPEAMRMKLLQTPELMKVTPPAFDAFSYHFYGSVSHRCMGNLKLEQALTSDWLDRTETVEAFYAAIRDKYLPGKPMWLTETAEAACGGDQLAAEFVDTFRFLNQLGTLAQKSVQVVMHNTLASSDYGLLDENTYEPRPDYWAALLWKRTMGPVVLNPGTPKHQPVRIYAHCSPEKHGSVTILALNTDRAKEQTLVLRFSGERYTLSSPELAGAAVMLNGVELKAAADGSIPLIRSESFGAGTVRLAPTSITFLTVPSARNQNCER